MCVCVFFVFVFCFTQDEVGQSTLKQDVIVIFGCACCLVQSALSLILLVTQWVRHPTCILYLKIQLCLAVVTQMCMFLYAAKNVIVFFPYPFQKTEEIIVWIPILSFFLKYLSISERLRIFFAVLANSDYSGDNVAFKPVAHRLHGDHQFPAVFRH